MNMMISYQELVRTFLSFDPPPMQGWKLHVKGRSSNEDKDYLVEEIVGLEINAMLPSTTAISHAEVVNKNWPPS